MSNMEQINNSVYILFVEYYYNIHYLDLPFSGRIIFFSIAHKIFLKLMAGRENAGSLYPWGVFTEHLSLSFQVL